MAIVMAHKTNLIPTDLAGEIAQDFVRAHLLEPDEFLEEIYLILVRIKAEGYCPEMIEVELDHLLEGEIWVEVGHLLAVEAFLFKDPQYV